MHLRNRQIPRALRGFTLTELLVTVAIVGVLATIGVSTFRSESGSSKTSEPAAVIQAIRAAEEAYRSENQRYLDVSTGTNWYPSAPEGNKKYPWVQTDHTDYTRWANLGPAVAQSVEFGFLVRAGGAGTKFPTLAVGITKPTDYDDARNEPWYVIQARADADGDKKYCEALATSLSNQILFVNIGE